MNSIRTRLTVWTLGGLFLVLAVGGFVIYISVRLFLCAEFDGMLAAQAGSLAALIRQDEGQIELEFSDDVMPDFQKKENPDYFQIWLQDGTTLERSRSLGSENLERRGGPAADPERWSIRLPSGKSGRAVGLKWVPLTDEGRTETNSERSAIGEVTLVVAKDRSGLDRSLAQTGAVIFFAGLLILLGASAVVKFSVRKGLAPLDEIAKKADDIDAATLSGRFPADSMPAELRVVGHKLNELLARLDESFRRERRFSANVAHELRTPIAELRTIAEVSLKFSGDEGDARRAFQDALDIAKQMEGVVTALLAITRSRLDPPSLRRERVNIAELVDDILRPLEKAIQSKHLTVWRDVTSATIIDSDPVIVRSIVQNILSNAVDYTPRAGRIEIRTSGAVDGFEFTVTNTVADLEPADMGRLFEPLWRKDPSRTDATHHGLGLTLAAEYARTLGMRLAAELIPGQKVSFTLKSE